MFDNNKIIKTQPHLHTTVTIFLEIAHLTPTQRPGRNSKLPNLVENFGK